MIKRFASLIKNLIFSLIKNNFTNAIDIQVFFNNPIIFLVFKITY